MYIVYLYICFLLLFPVKWFVYLFALLNAGSNSKLLADALIICILVLLTACHRSHRRSR